MVWTRLAAALIAFLAAVLATPYALALLLGCFPPEGSCGDGAAWEWIVSAPISIPLALIVAARSPLSAMAPLFGR